MTVLLLAAVCGRSDAQTPVTDLKAEARNGQVFLTWKEAETPAGTTFNVYSSSKPIKSAKSSDLVGHHIERRSARDWWEDPASFRKDEKPGEPVGFLIEDGGKRLDPSSGLFVDTVSKDSEGKGYYAVTFTGPDGKEDKKIAPGENSLSKAVLRKVGDMSPIWQHDGKPPSPGAGKGKALSLSLHGKGGVVANSEYLLFGDETMGWRRGLPFKFSVQVSGDQVLIRPTDRVWIGRPGDSGAPATWTFWYGYSSKVYDAAQMEKGIATNYTEHRLLWIVKWVREHYQTDPNASYVSGSSMGGCGSISFGLRHPEIFAALHARVPIYSYTNPPSGSASRLVTLCWTGPITKEVKTNEGIPLLDRMNGAKLVTEATGDLPYIFATNGRKDASIPWENNPPFYRACNEARQGCAFWWDDGIHPTAGKDAPEDVHQWEAAFKRFRLDQSYPAFSNTSANKDPGDGDPTKGDIIGWINRGMEWKDLEDKPNEYAITITVGYPGIAYPVKTDMTLRRVQRFKTQPGETVTAQIGRDRPVAVKADRNGRITIPGIAIPSGEGVRVTVRRGK
ncbi:MAG: alpha/beta hydrolase-fold protein [Planctomycetota bacterium]